MNTELFTEKAREAIIQAQQPAEEHRNAQLEPEHLPLALQLMLRNASAR